MADSKTEREPWFSDCGKLLPVAFVFFTIGILYFLFLACHLLPGLAEHEHAGPERTQILIRVAIFHLITSLVVTCYARSMAVHPGSIPDNDDNWSFVPYDARAPKIHTPSSTLHTLGKKRSGNRRSCKWCQKFKPDRCHHCRLCKTCVLKMDHHCPWIYNCVGFQNYKYFFLLLFYSMLDLHFISMCLTSTVRAAVKDKDTPFVQMVGALFGWTLSTFLGILTTMFWTFHIWLCSKSLTTIEFCEKRLPKKKQGEASVYDNSVYNRGFVGNIKATLGDNYLLMLLPCSPPSGDGLDFVSSDMRLLKHFDTSKSGRRITHQVAQRPVKWEGFPPHLPADLLESGSTSDATPVSDVTPPPELDDKKRPLPA